MDDLHIYHEVETLLRQEERFCTDSGALNKNVIVEAALALDDGLLRLLLNGGDVERCFFQTVGDTKVFDKVKFQRFIRSEDFLPGNYTLFKKKIGLANEDQRFISESREVVLDWPYKDCILEGGQTKEDAKRDEIFWNETLAPDEINRLKEPKAFANFAHYDRDGRHSVSHLKPTDNLIIKGNNLLALYSLEKRYAGKVKLIYIDPPYYFTASKREDTFLYNSNFKLSTWCTFMLNRLEVARRLLSDDGAIFVQINDDGESELFQILKLVFNTNGENKFINRISVKTKSPSGFASVNPGVFESAEYILAFANHKKIWTYNQQYVKSDYDSNYKWYIPHKDEDSSKWKIYDMPEYIAKENGFSSKKQAIDKLGKFVFQSMVAEFALEHKDAVFRYTAIGNNAGADVLNVKEKSLDNRGGIYEVNRNSHYNVFVRNGQELAFYSKKVRNIDGEEVPSIQLSNIWNDISYEGIANEGNVKLKGGKKPEKLLRRIIEMATNRGDLIMDFFSGSGTTASVAHKLGRRFIACDQLDSQLLSTVSRVTDAIAGEQGGVSKAVGWKGGGEFVYCELATANQKFVDAIVKAENEAELEEIWEAMQQKAFISYRVDLKTINKSAEDYSALSIEDKKRFLIETLDKNLLYVPYSDMESKEYDLSEEDKRLSREFYAKSNI